MNEKLANKNRKVGKVEAQSGQSSNANLANYPRKISKLETKTSKIVTHIYKASNAYLASWQTSNCKLQSYQPQSLQDSNAKPAA
jgi:hypothetical protein